MDKIKQNNPGAYRHILLDQKPRLNDQSTSDHCPSDKERSIKE